MSNPEVCSVPCLSPIWPSDLLLGCQAPQVRGGSSIWPTCSYPSLPYSSSVTASSSSSSSTRNLMSVPPSLSLKKLSLKAGRKIFDCSGEANPEEPWVQPTGSESKVEFPTLPNYILTFICYNWQVPNLDVHPFSDLASVSHSQQQSQLPHLLLCWSKVHHHDWPLEFFSPLAQPSFISHQMKHSVFLPDNLQGFTNTHDINHSMSCLFLSVPWKCDKAWFPRFRVQFRRALSSCCTGRQSPQLLDTRFIIILPSQKYCAHADWVDIHRVNLTKTLKIGTLKYE